jgi:hypothetical protein
MLTLILPIDPTQLEEVIDDHNALSVGQILKGEDDLELEILEYYQYSPIVLGDDCRIALAFVKEVGQPTLNREDWYGQQAKYSPLACWHIYTYQGEVLRMLESSSGEPPKLDTPYYHYCTGGSLMHQSPKLDRYSLTHFRATAQQRSTELKSEFYRKYVHPDSSIREIYVVELATSKALCAA